MKPQEFYEKIEQFLNEEMTTDEQMQFQQSIHNDPALAQEVALHRGLHLALADTEVINLEKTLQEVDAQVKIPAQEAQGNVGRIVPLSPFRKYRALAAALVVLIVAAIVFQLFLGKNTDPFADNFQTYPMYLETRSTQQNLDELAQKAANAYRGGDFLSAFADFTTLAEKQPTEWGFAFYTGLSALEIGNTDAATFQLNAVVEHGDSIYAGQARWYLALSYLKAGQTDQAKAQLQQIVSQKLERSKQASELLDKLD